MTENKHDVLSGYIRLTFPRALHFFFFFSFFFNQVSLHQNNRRPKAFAKTDCLLWQALITLESCGKTE